MPQPSALPRGWGTVPTTSSRRDGGEDPGSNGASRRITRHAPEERRRPPSHGSSRPARCADRAALVRLASRDALGRAPRRSCGRGRGGGGRSRSAGRNGARVAPSPSPARPAPTLSAPLPGASPATKSTRPTQPAVPSCRCRCMDTVDPHLAPAAGRYPFPLSPRWTARLSRAAPRARSGSSWTVSPSRSSTKTKTPGRNLAGLHLAGCSSFEAPVAARPHRLGLRPLCALERSLGGRPLPSRRWHAPPW